MSTPERSFTEVLLRDPTGYPLFATGNPGGMIAAHIAPPSTATDPGPEVPPLREPRPGEPPTPIIPEPVVPQPIIPDPLPPQPSSPQPDSIPADHGRHAVRCGTVWTP